VNKVRKNKWVKNKYMWFGFVIFLIISLITIGSLLLDGENPLKMGTTLWYLNNTDRNVLWVAGDGVRYVTYKRGIEKHILDYLDRLNGVSRGNWEAIHLDDHTIRYQIKDDKLKSQVEISYKTYLEKYAIFTYQVSKQNK
jgi:hypothetical protein